MEHPRKKHLTSSEGNKQKGYMTYENIEADNEEIIEKKKILTNRCQKN